MSRWPGKYVIGLTGNIATGKSVIRKMLEHLGAYGIDADALSHRAMAKGAPGFPLVTKTFGEWIVDAEGQIDRARLAKIVFSDAGALEKLSRDREVLEVANRATQHLYIVNPIKPFEKRAKGLFSTHPPIEERIARLRGLVRA